MISIIHLYAKEYGYTRDYILDSVYIDEYILQHEMIVDTQRNDWLMKSHIALLPNFEDKDREKFLESLQKEEEYKPMKVEQKTDFDAIDRAKAQLARLDKM